MKFEVLVTVLALLTVGCSKSQSNRAIVNKIDKIYQEVNGAEGYSGTASQLESLLYELKRRGYFHRKEVLLDIEPNTVQWTNASNQAVAFATNRAGKAATLELGPYLVAAAKDEWADSKTIGLSIVVWDRPSEMEKWNKLIHAIKNENQCAELIRRSVTVIDDRYNPIEGVYVVGYGQSMERAKKQTIAQTDKYGSASIYMSGSVIMAIGKEPFYPQYITSSSETNITITLNSNTQTGGLAVGGEVLNPELYKTEKSQLWKEWGDYLQWLEQNK